MTTDHDTESEDDWCQYAPQLTAELGYPIRCPHCPPSAAAVPPTHWTKHVQRHHPDSTSQATETEPQPDWQSWAERFGKETSRLRTELAELHAEMERRTLMLQASRDVTARLRADRAAVLHEAAQRLYTALFPAVYADMGQKAAEGVNRAVSELRRMADETAATETERCAHCTHPKGDHDGRADHRAKHSPLVAGEPWCHACNAPCDYTAAGARQDGA